MKKHVHLGLLILELSKILMYEFWYCYGKPNYGEKEKLCCIDTDSFIAYIKASYICKDIAEDVKTGFDTSSYELDKPLHRRKKKKVTGLMKDELGGNIITKFVRSRGKTYKYLIDDGSEDEKAKGTKKRVIKRKLNFENYKNCLNAIQFENKIKHLGKNKTDTNRITKNHKESLKNNKSILKTQPIIKIEGYNIFNEEISKIALSSNDNKRIQSTDSIETYRTSKDLISEKEEIKCNQIIKPYKSD